MKPTVTLLLVYTFCPAAQCGRNADILFDITAVPRVPLPPSPRKVRLLKATGGRFRTSVFYKVHAMFSRISRPMAWAALDVDGTRGGGAAFSQDSVREKPSPPS